MSRDAPPQTLHDAIAMGWTALTFRCNRCKHEGRVDLTRFDLHSRTPSIGEVFWRCRCGKCGRRPTYAKLAAPLNDGRWYEKRIEIDGDTIRRAARE